MEHFYKNLSTYVCGDIHGDFHKVIELIKKFNIRNSIIILAGDVGFGFNKLSYYETFYTKKMHDILDHHNVTLLAVRGNHDDPFYYHNGVIQFPYLKTIGDYDIIVTSYHNILCIGGAYSSDRKYRIRFNDRMARYGSNKRAWWKDEVPYLDESILANEEYDVIVSHCAPFLAPPVANVWGGTFEDRRTMDKVYELAKNKVKHWYYGHYHNHDVLNVGSTTFHLLNIYELAELK